MNIDRLFIPMYKLPSGWELLVFKMSCVAHVYSSYLFFPNSNRNFWKLLEMIIYVLMNNFSPQHNVQDIYMFCLLFHGILSTNVNVLKTQLKENMYFYQTKLWLGRETDSVFFTLHPLSHLTTKAKLLRPLPFLTIALVYNSFRMPISFDWSFIMEFNPRPNYNNWLWK